MWLQGVYCGKTTNGVIVAIKTDFQSLYVLFDGQVLNILIASSFSPIASCNRNDTNRGEVAFNAEDKFGLGLDSSRHDKNLRRKID